MYRLNSYIVFANFSFTACSSVEINSSWENFTDTAVITLPTNLKESNVNLVNGLSAGDTVEIYLGYYPSLDLRFTGVISKVAPNNPITIYCEDLMWTLKQTQVNNYSENAATLNSLLTTICPIDFEAADANLGTVRIKTANVVEVLSYLKDNYGLISYLRDGELKVGLPFTELGSTHKFSLDGADCNVVNSDNLVYEKSSDKNITIKGVSIANDNSRLIRYAYYQNGEVVTATTSNGGAERVLYYSSITATELENTISDKLPQFIYTGYRGSFLAFLKPAVNHGDNVVLTSYKFPERGGTYNVKRVVTTFGVNGGRQEIFLDAKIG